ncbi:hypothetical protein HRH25_23575 [Flavisolibacter sp. BT320]|nr:hypothetical protein [Flavisolibacter longurius]
MNRLFTTFILAAISFELHAQVLLEDKTGDVIVRDQFRADDNLALFKLNTGDQSLGFTYIKSTRYFKAGEAKNGYRINEFGIKAKPTEGYAAVFTNGQFSPGVKISYALTKVRIFSQDDKEADPPKKAGFFDWGGFEINYDINKYSLYNNSAAFGEQFYSKTFKPLSAFLHYNYFVTRGGLNSKFLISLKAGYARRSSYDALATANIQDVKSLFDSTSSTTRQTINNRSVRTGTYEEFDAYPITLSLTFLTRTDPATISRTFQVPRRIILDSSKLKKEITTKSEFTGKDTTILKDTTTYRTFDKMEDTTIIVPNPDLKKLRVGVNTYLKNIASDINLPNTKLGMIFFLTRQDEKTGVRAPIFGLNIQADDPFDVQKVKNGLQSRISIGFTSIISF